MPSASNVQARKAARVRASAHTLRLVYPPTFVATAVTPTPGAQPVSPLTGPRVQNTLIPPTQGPPTNQALIVPCLWYDAPVSPTLATTPDARVFGAVGWRDGAHALAEVLVSDVAEDPSNPYGATKLDGVLQLEHGSRSYRLLEYRPTGAGFAQPATYYVWLVSATHQEV